MHFSIIGGADGPTSIFIASRFSIVPIAIAIVAIVGTIIFSVIKNKNKK